MASPTTANRVVLGELRDLLAAVQADGHPDKYAGKRKSTRFRDGVFLELTTDPANPGDVQNVHLHNLSGEGFACWARSRLSVRKTVYLRQPTENNSGPWVRGVVTHCTVGLRGFLIGGRFEASPAPCR